MDEKQFLIREASILNAISCDTSEVYKLAASFAALISFSKRKLSENQYKWIGKWIYDIMDYMDYELREKHDPADEFRRIYNVDYYSVKINTDKFKIDYIKEYTDQYDKAINTYGEVKLSARPSYIDNYDTLSTKEQRDINLAATGLLKNEPEL